MRRVLAIAGVLEIATGLALFAVPSLVGRLLLGEELTGVAILLARVAGIALVGLGVACWPGTPMVGMLTYTVAVALYLAYVGLAGGASGMLQWPAVAVHLALAVFLVVAWWRSR
jgi:drug/metabolite transporter (DMT)-like permease